MHRHWEEYHTGSDGDEVICTEVKDVCEKCERIHAKSRRALMPCREIGELFDRWDDGGMQKEQFDESLVSILRKAGGEWRKVS